MFCFVFFHSFGNFTSDYTYNTFTDAYTSCFKTLWAVQQASEGGCCLPGRRREVRDTSPCQILCRQIHTIAWPEISSWKLALHVLKFGWGLQHEQALQTLQRPSAARSLEPADRHGNLDTPASKEPENPLFPSPHSLHTQGVKTQSHNIAGKWKTLPQAFGKPLGVHGFMPKTPQANCNRRGPYKCRDLFQPRKMLKTTWTLDHCYIQAWKLYWFDFRFILSPFRF